MITLKFQENIEGNWGYVPNFSERDYSSSVEDGHTLGFFEKLSKQPYNDIVKFAEFIGKFKDFTLIAHTAVSYTHLTLPTILLV